MRDRRKKCEVCLKSFTDHYLPKHKCSGPPKTSSSIANRCRLVGKRNPDQVIEMNKRLRGKSSQTRMRLNGKQNVVTTTSNHL